MQLADMEVARASDFGKNDERLHIRSHVGSNVRPGNWVLGYDLRTVNVTSDMTDAVNEHRTDVILVRKQYKKRKQQRQWSCDDCIAIWRREQRLSTMRQTWKRS